MVMALEDADHVIDCDALHEDNLLLESRARFKELTKNAFLRMVHDQRAPERSCRTMLRS